VRAWEVADPRHPTPLGPPLAGATSYVYSLALSRDWKQSFLNEIGPHAWEGTLIKARADRSATAFDSFFEVVVGTLLAPCADHGA